MNSYYKNEQEIDAVIKGFEDCTTGKNEFTHLCHLTVAVFYLRNSNPDQAFDKMRAGLLRFLDHHGIGRAKYKDQLTLAWIKLIHSHIEQMEPNLSLLEITNAVLERLGNYRIPEEQHLMLLL